MKHASCALAGALILVSACIGDEFLTTSGTGGTGPSSSSLTGPTSSSVGGTDTSSTSSSVTASTTDSSSSVSTSVSSSSGGGDGGDATAGTGGDGGGGSTSANGGGGSTSESSAGGAGGDPTVSSSSSAGGEGGGGVLDPYWRLRWTIDAPVAGGRMGLGGTINQPSGTDTLTGEEPFVDVLSNDLCVVNDDTELVLVCNLGELQTGTYLQLHLYMYEGDGDFYAYMCDRANVANGECKGEVRLEYVEDGVPTTVSTFIDDENGGTPLPAPWEYFGTGTEFRQLVYPSLPAQ